MKKIRLSKKYSGKRPLIISLVLFLSFIVLAYAQKDHSKKAPADINSVCLDCHSDPDISMSKKGKDISLTVKKFDLARSPHNKLKCTQCHAGFNPDDIPHKENILPVNCQSCHGNVSAKHPFHPKMGQAGANSQITDCKSCHGTHDVVSPKQPNSKLYFTNSTNFCGNCHKSEKTDQMQSVHFVELNKQNPKAPTCIYCHTSPITKGNSISDAQLKVNQEKLCLDCHLKNPGATQFSKNLVEYDKSVHGMAIKRGNSNAAVCVDCHGAHNLQKRNSPKSNINPFKIPDICGKCHISINQEYSASIHGIQLEKGNRDVPGCTYCHGEHNISPLPDVPPRVFEETHIKHSTIVRNKMVYCIACHADEKLMKKYKLNTVAKAHEWLPNQAIHWETVRCVDCHSSYTPPNLAHNILPLEKTVRNCEKCHTQNSILMSKLYKHEKETSRQKFGFINGTILSDAYVIGTTRNIFLDAATIIVFLLTAAFLGLHALLRWYFHRSGESK